MAVNLYS